MPFLVELANGVKDFQYYYGGLGNFSQKPDIPKVKYTAFDDGLIRGGVINSTIATTRDVARISKFFLSTKGVTFTAKQVGLQLTNPLLEQEAPQSLANVQGNFAQKALTTISNVAKTIQNSIGSTRVYNLGLNTLAQVGVEAFGQHIVRHGLLPKTTSDYNYQNIALENDKNGKNRLVGYLDKIKDNTGAVTLKTYIGGPSSTYGIGVTSIKTTNVRTDFNPLAKNNNFVGLTYNQIVNIDDTYNNLVQGYNGGLNPNTTNPYGVKFQLGSQLVSQQRNKAIFEANAQAASPNSIKAVQNKKLANQAQSNINALESQIFRADYSFKDFRAAKTGIPAEALDYYVNNRDSRIGTSTKDKVDSINVINIASNDVFYKNSSTATLPNTTADAGVLASDKVNGLFGRDIIKFRLEFLDNDKPISAGGVNTDVLAFRAYIDNFDDGIDAKWDSYRYMGRGEEFYVYNGFTRDISVTFTIFAHTKEEMKPIYNKLNYLMSTFAPDYNDGLKMRGNIGYLTVGDYVYRQPGVYTSMRISNILDSNWEIALNEPEGGSDADQYELPKYLKVTLQFKPIHSFLPRRNSRRVGAKAKFITPDLDNNKYLSNVVTGSASANGTPAPLNANQNTQNLSLSNPAAGTPFTPVGEFKSFFGG